MLQCEIKVLIHLIRCPDIPPSTGLLDLTTNYLRPGFFIPLTTFTWVGEASPHSRAHSCSTAGNLQVHFFPSGTLQC